MPFSRSLSRKVSRSASRSKDSGNTSIPSADMLAKWLVSNGLIDIIGISVMTITGTWPNVTFTAVSGDILSTPDWIGGRSHFMPIFLPSPYTRIGQRGVAIYSLPLSDQRQFQADRFFSILPTVEQYAKELMQ